MGPATDIEEEEVMTPKNDDLIYEFGGSVTVCDLFRAAALAGLCARADVRIMQKEGQGQLFREAVVEIADFLAVRMVMKRGE